MADNFQADKDAIVSEVKSHNCDVAVMIDRNAQTYSALIDYLFDYSKTFDCDTAYLETLLNLLDDSTLTDNGVFYNKTGTDINNPIAIVKSTYTNVYLNTGGIFNKLLVTDNSTVENIIVQNETTVLQISIEGVSSVNLIDSTAENCCARSISVAKCATNGNISTLNHVQYLSCYYEVFVEEGAVYNGETCPPTGVTV